MKRLMICLLAVFVLNCSSDDDTTNLDLNLLYGQWYRVGLCAEQNSLLLNSNNTFISYSSGAIDCNDPEPDTYKYTGNYEISGNFYYPNEQTRELIIDGTNLTVFEFEDPNIKREIIELSETSLVIKVYLDNGNNTIDVYGEYTYEH